MQQAGIAGLRYYSLLIVNAPHSHGDSSIEVLQVPPTPLAIFYWSLQLRDFGLAPSLARVSISTLCWSALN